MTAASGRTAHETDLVLSGALFASGDPRGTQHEYCFRADDLTDQREEAIDETGAKTSADAAITKDTPIFVKRCGFAMKFKWDCNDTIFNTQ